MPNNIVPLNNELRARADEKAELAAEVFDSQAELTPEEKEKVAELEASVQTVVVSTDKDGRSVQTDIEDYARAVDAVKAITAPDGENSIKAVNGGDIKKTVDDIKSEAREKAMKAFRDFSTAKGDDVLTDEEIIRINDEALKAIQDYFGEERLDSNKTIKKLAKLPLQKLIGILPTEFVETYTIPSELRAGNYKAKERLLSTLAYLTATGPEMDYLNEYIDHQNVLMELSRQLMKAEVDLANVLSSKEKMSEIVRKATEQTTPSDKVWTKYIRDPRQVQNEFAQRAIVCEEYRAAYAKFLDQYTGEDKTSQDARKMIQEQIDECDNKCKAYRDVTELTLMRELWGILEIRLKANRKNNYKNLEREAVAALDRIRRAKQNVPFPIYDAKYANRPELLYKLYMEGYPNMLAAYNRAVDKVYKEAGDDEAASTGVVPIHIDGIGDHAVFEFYSMLLLILYGRIMKRLGERNNSKYDAIMLDCYFQVFCKMGVDVYLMTDVWNICKDFVEYCIVNYGHMASKN